MARKVSTNPGDVSLSKSIDSRLKVYGMAAAAASVGLLALAEPAQSEVVITNKNIPIPRCDGLHSCPVKVDLNHDGIADFSFTLGYYGYGQNINAQIGVEALTGGGVIGGGFESSASALVRGAKIGSSGKFLSFSVKLERSSYATVFRSATHHLFGDWGGNHPNRFLGVKFLIHGKTHYGWIRVTVTTSTKAPMSAEITEYGYETVANKSCDAGLPGASAAPSDDARDRDAGPALGMLALGADALPLWRHDELVQSGKLQSGKQ
ncbi:MAG: hypothetical protein WCB05_21905 [Candidatus Sulfotelmatobacter sp.]|jgi:hypothetical protein